MKQIAYTIIFLFLSINFISCNKETFHESIGYALPLEAKDEEVGYFIFKSTKAVTTCGPLSIYIDGKLVGKLTKDHTDNIICTTPPKEGEIVKVVATEGMHSIEVKFDSCGVRSASYNLPQGSCMIYSIN